MKAFMQALSLPATSRSLALLLVTMSPGAWAQAKEPPAAYPSKAIRVISASGPGSGNDILARLIGQHLSTSVRQPVVVDNRPGASGALAESWSWHGPRGRNGPTHQRGSSR